MAEWRSGIQGSANDRLKATWSERLSAGLITAVAIHLGLFLAWPTTAVAARDYVDDVPDIIRIDEFELPPAPEPIVRPARPVVSDVAPEHEPVFQVVDWDDVPEQGPPAPRSDEGAVTSQPGFVPFEVAPRLLNPDEVSRALTAAYPGVLRDAGIGGTVRVWFRLDAQGSVVDTRLAETSGVPRLDSAAFRVADRMRFAPAQNRDRPVEVWVAIPITFQVR